MKNELKFSILFIACLLPVICLQAQQKNIKFEEYTLDNGLHVILHQDNSTPIVANTIMYHAGAKNDPSHATGTAHFLEHLMFEGTKNIGRGKFAEYVENAGGTLNANTSYDRTFYYEVLPSNKLGLGLWLESERLMHAVAANKKEGVETQRDVVIEERRERSENTPYGMLLEETMKRVFKTHPYQYPVIGSMDHIKNVEAETLNNFYETYYVPNNAVLSIAGDIDIDSTKTMVEKYFGEIPRGSDPIEMPELNDPGLKKEVRDTVYDNINLPAVVMAYRSPEQGTEAYYAMDMLGTLLTEGESSRLNKVVKNQKQKAVQVGTYPLSLEDYGVTLAYGIANSGVDAKALEQAIQIEIDKVKENLISKRELEKIKNQVENNFVSSNSSVSGKAESLAQYHMYFGDANLINTEIERYMDVSREDIKKVANKYLNKDNRVVLYYLPESSKDQ